MSIFLWLIWRRWVFAKWTKGADPSVVLRSCHNHNLAGCRTHPFIYNDMCRILGRV